MAVAVTIFVFIALITFVVLVEDGFILLVQGGVILFTVATIALVCGVIWYGTHRPPCVKFHKEARHYAESTIYIVTGTPGVAIPMTEPAHDAVIDVCDEYAK